jgi:arylsulfatase A-like enzyme
MLEDTLIVFGGEFGRTPTVELNDAGAAKAGRDHNPYGFSMWLADEFGFKTAENIVHVHDFHATILHLLGFEHEKFTYRYAGRDFRLTDVKGKVVKALLV